MRLRIYNTLDMALSTAEVVGSSVRMGASPYNDIVLDNPDIGDRSLLLYQHEDRWVLRNTGAPRAAVDDCDIRIGDEAPLAANAKIDLYPYTVLLEEQPEEGIDEYDRSREDLDREMSGLIQKTHIELLSIMDIRSDDEERRENPSYLLALEHNIEEILRLAGLCDAEQLDVVDHIAGHNVRQCVINEIIQQAGEEQDESALVHTELWTRLASQLPEKEDALDDIVNQIIADLGVSEIKDLSDQINRVESRFWSEWDQLCEYMQDELLIYLALRELKKQLKDIIFGYGPLEDLLRLPTITEIMVVRSDLIYIERTGLLENSGRRFISDDVTLAVIDRIVQKVGRQIDKSRPLVDARLSDGSRVNAVIPPLAVSGPCITIRKFPVQRLSIADLIESGSLTKTSADFLRAAIISGRNVLVSGGTGTGKTTLLNCLSEFIPDKERIVTVEDTAELRLSKTHVVRMETKQKNAEGHGEYTIQDLVKNALRMRPHRIIVGECRGAEALDMLQAMNTGHDGSMTTIHANSPRDVPLRLEVLVRNASELPVDSIRRQIASSIDLVVQLSRSSTGRRCVSSITEITEFDERSGQIVMKDLFQLEAVGGAEELRPTGHLPTFMDRLINESLIDLSAFYR